jgi:hypothetical protein
VSTLVVCGATALMLWPSVSDASTPVDAFAAATSHQTPDDCVWTASTIDLDSPDDCDDDGGDDAPGASSALAPGGNPAALLTETRDVVHVTTCSIVFRTSDARSVRGPPSAAAESSDPGADVAEDSDDEHLHRRFEAAGPRADADGRSNLLAPSAPVLSRSSEGQFLRAP